MRPDQEIADREMSRAKKGCLMFIVLLAAAAFFMWVMRAEAAEAKYKELPSSKNYNCSVVKKPARPAYVWYKYPDKKHPDRDAYNNGKVKLIWDDSFRAHYVEIRYRQLGKDKWKKFITEDDASTWVKGMKNGVRYEFEVRGVSNCGKSKWRGDDRIRA